MGSPCAIVGPHKDVELVADAILIMVLDAFKKFYGVRSMTTIKTCWYGET